MEHRAWSVDQQGHVVRPAFDGLTLSHEDLANMVCQMEVIHPLLRLQAQVEQDLQRPATFRETE